MKILCNSASTGGDSGARACTCTRTLVDISVMCVNAGCRQTDLDTRTWHQPETRGSPLPEARAGHSGTVVASMDADASCAPSLVIFGGHAVNGSLSDVYSLRITSAAAREVAGEGAEAEDKAAGADLSRSGTNSMMAPVAAPAAVAGTVP